MPTITRTWLAFAAIGVGLIHIALVIGSPLALGIILAVLGLTEFGWGVLTLARETVVLPRVALAVAVAPIVLWGLLLVTSTVAKSPELAASMVLLPLAVATLFELFIAGTLAVHLRRRAAPHGPSPRVPSVARYLLAVLVGGLAVASLTTPALAATAAGLYSAPHGVQSETHVEEDEPFVLNLPEHDVGH